MSIRSCVAVVAGLWFGCSSQAAPLPPQPPVNSNAMAPAVAPTPAQASSAGSRAPTVAAPLNPIGGSAAPAMIGSMLMPAPSTVPGQPAAMPAEGGEHAPRIAFAALRVADEMKELAFYASLGLKERARRKTTAGTTEIEVAFPEPGGAYLLLVSEPGHAIVRGDAYSRIGLRVDGIDTLIESLRTAGATVLSQPARTEALKLTYSLVRDPEGYLLELLQFDAPADPAMAPQAPLPRIGFISFNLGDTDASLGFYSRVFQLERRGMFDASGVTEIFVSFADTLANEATLVLLSKGNRKGALQLGDAFDRFGIRVADVQSVAMRLASENVTPKQPVTRDDEAKASALRFTDLDGYLIEAVQYD